MKIHKTEPAGGGILIFLTGVEEITECVDILNDEVQKLKKSEGNTKCKF